MTQHQDNITQDAKPHETHANVPVDRLYDGNLKASIWKNRSESGKAFYSAEFARTYKDEEGHLRDAHSFAGTDFLKLSELARKTYERTAELRREDFERARQDQTPQRKTDRQR